MYYFIHPLLPPRFVLFVNYLLTVITGFEATARCGTTKLRSSISTVLWRQEQLELDWFISHQLRRFYNIPIGGFLTHHKDCSVYSTVYNLLKEWLETNQTEGWQWQFKTILIVILPMLKVKQYSHISWPNECSLQKRSIFNINYEIFH